MDESRTPIGLIGVVAPMNALGLAPFAGLGLIYEEAMVLAPAALYQVSFSRQQANIIADLEQTALALARANSDWKSYDIASMVHATLKRQFATGYRLVIAFDDGREVKFIVQRGSADEIRRCFTRLLADRFNDESAMAVA